MEILSILENEALKQLKLISGKTKKQIEQIINNYLVNNGLIYEGDPQVFGNSVQDIINNNILFNINEVVEEMFELKDYRETTELMTSIYFFNELNDCNICGCKTENEFDGMETITICTNYCI